MQDWVLAKHAIVAWMGLDPDALVVLASLLVALLAALATRRPLSNGVPWLVALALGLADEAAGIVAGPAAAGAGLAGAGRDLALFMAVPTLLMGVGRFLPHLLSPRPDRRILIPAVWEKKAPVVEAVFRENAEEGARKASAR